MNARNIIIVSLIINILICSIPQKGSTPVLDEQVQVHAVDKWITESRDVTLVLPWSIGFSDWEKWVLWDDLIFTHFYLSWKLGVEYELHIPATLSLTYPRFFEPGENLQEKLSIDFGSDRFLVVKPNIGIGVDVDLLIPVLIGNVWVERFAPLLDLEWEWMFSFSQESLEVVPRALNLTDVGQSIVGSVSDVGGISQYVRVEDLFLSGKALGELASGEVKINILHLILDLAEELTRGTIFTLIFGVLDWFITQALRIESGLVIKPQILTTLGGNIDSSSSELEPSTSGIVFENDDDEPTFSMLVSSMVREGDQFSIDVGPLIYTYSMIFDWEWYISVDTQLLGLPIAQNEWRTQIMRFPAASWESEPVMERFNLGFHVDEPLLASSPEVSQWAVVIELEDPSGISKVDVEYNWANWFCALTPLFDQGEFFVGTFPNFNILPTPLAYQFRVTDGDGDTYIVADNGQLFFAILPPNYVLLAVYCITILILSVIFIRIKFRRGGN